MPKILIGIPRFSEIHKKVTKTVHYVLIGIPKILIDTPNSKQGDTSVGEPHP